MKTTKIKQAVILAGGRGTRLRPLTNDRPKPMVLVNDRPFIEYQLDVFKKNGIEEIVFLVGYLKEKIIEHFGDGRHFGLTIKYHAGKPADDTGTRIKNAKKILDKNFLLSYGDVYWPFLELRKMSEFYYASGKKALMVAYDNKDGQAEEGFKCNSIIDGRNMVTCYGPHTDDPRFKWAPVGFFILSEKALDLMPRSGNFNFHQTTLPDLAVRGELIAWKTNKAQDTITSPRHLADFAAKMSRLKK